MHSCEHERTEGLTFSAEGPARGPGESHERAAFRQHTSRERRTRGARHAGRRKPPPCAEGRPRGISALRARGRGNHERPAATSVRCAQGDIGSRATWPGRRCALRRLEPRTRATGQRSPSQEVIGRARVPTLMPGRCANAHQAGHRAAFTGTRRPRSAALPLPPRAIDPSRRSKVAVAIDPSCHARASGARGRHTKTAATRTIGTNSPRRGSC